MNKIAHEIAKEVTDQQVQRLAKVENLMKLKTSLQEDKESAEEIIGEIIEQRRETCLALGVDVAPIESALTDLMAAFTAVKENAQQAQLEAMKND